MGDWGVGVHAKAAKVAKEEEKKSLRPLRPGDLALRRKRKDARSPRRKELLNVLWAPCVIASLREIRLCELGCWPGVPGT